MDSVSEQKLSAVDADLAARVRQMANNLSRQGIVIRVSSGLRSTAKQASLYANRASNPNPVAKPGTSKHEKGLAVDVVAVGSNSASVQRAIGDEGKRVGLIWGGDFSKADPVHFEWAANGVEEYVRSVVSDASSAAAKKALDYEVKKHTGLKSEQALLIVGGAAVVALLLGD
ncbi:MAG: M15 family metallopeptidase [Pyrinomonadaceae bacterium]